MWKLCLAFLFCVGFSFSALADLNALYVRLECNRDLGILDIQYNNIFEGRRAYSYFERHKNVYKYPVDKMKNGNVEIELLNGYFYKEPYMFHCELGANYVYDVTITNNKKADCMNDRGYIVNVVQSSEQGKKEAKVLFDNVSLGCNAALDRIIVVPEGENDKYSYYVGEQHNEYASFLFQQEEAISNERIEKQHQDMMEHMVFVNPGVVE